MFELEKILVKKRPKRPAYGGWNKTGKSCADHLGREFSSVRERAEFYGVPPDRVLNRMKSGWTLEEALTIPAIDAHCRRFWRNGKKS